jgi:hypothetical protein
VFDEFAESQEEDEEVDEDGYNFFGMGRKTEYTDEVVSEEEPYMEEDE